MKHRQWARALIAVTALSGRTLLGQTPNAEHLHSPGTRIVGKPLILDLPGLPDTVVRITTIDFDPGGVVDAHCHHGPEYGTVTEGVLMVKVDKGEYQPMEKGKMFTVSARIPMYVKNVSDKPAQLVSTLVVDRNAPFLTYLSDDENDCLKN